MKSYRDCWRKLDNTAKIFSLSVTDEMSVFRLSAVLKKEIKEDVLFKAVVRALHDYPEYRVRLGNGVFWSYLEFNDKAPIVEEENDIPCTNINLRKNNDYLFKVTYFNNKINLDIYHVLTDGTGAVFFFRGIIYHYLSLIYKMKSVFVSEEELNSIDQYLNYYDSNYKNKKSSKKAFIIPGKANMNINNTYHYTVSIKEIKSVCKGYKVTITEFITAIYIYSLYLSYYKKSNKDIIVSVPINLRKYYEDETLSNFFTYMNIDGNINDKVNVSFEDILVNVKKEFLNKLNSEKVKEYLSRDMKLGNNLSIRLVPLFIKKLFIKYLGKLVNSSATTRLSNIGIVDISDEYKKYIDNIYVLVSPNKVQKIKCTICSYGDNLNISINSNVNDNKFEDVFYKELNNYVKKINVESNKKTNKRKGRLNVSNKNKK